MTTEHDWSEKNSKKLDRILLLIEGDGDNSPGLSGRVKTIEKTLYGDGDERSMTTRVSIMWRAHIWLLCVISGIATLLVRELYRLIFKI